MGKRNAYALAAKQRKAGPHDKFDDLWDKLNRYEEKEMLELAARWGHPSLDRDYDIDDVVEVITSNSNYLGETGRVVERSPNNLWGVDFGDSQTLWFLETELMRA